MKHNIYERNGVRVVIPTLENYKDVAFLIKSDYFRNSGQTLSIFKIWSRTLLWGGATNLLFWFRVSQYRKGWLYYFAEVMRKRASVKYGLQISSRMRVRVWFQHLA